MEIPPWLKTKYRFTPQLRQARSIIEQHGLNTVCYNAMSRNCDECLSAGTATFMLLGNTHTGNCRFCATKAHAKEAGPDGREPDRIANAVKKMALRYVVITSANRNDLHDLGVSHFARTAKKVKEVNAKTRIELLLPDFNWEDRHLKRIVDVKADVICYNLGAVRRLTPAVRGKKASYERSLSILRKIKTLSSSQLTKSSILVGLGEMPAEVMAALRHLRRAGTGIVTIGQYIRPTARHAKAAEHVTEEMFELYERTAWQLGFRYVSSGPFVRSLNTITEL